MANNVEWANAGAFFRKKWEVNTFCAMSLHSLSFLWNDKIE